MNTLDFIARLHAGGGWAYWWTLPDRRSVWWPTDEPKPVPVGEFDVYFGVHSSRLIPKSNAVGEERSPEYVRSQTAGIQQINCLFAEFDIKDFPDESACRDHINNISPFPSYIISSGGGFHCYWVLREPWTMNGDETLSKARTIQSAWVDYVGGDNGAKDLARVLRAPGTRNHKYTPSRPVEIVRESDIVFSLEELEKAMALPPTLEMEKPDPLDTEDTAEFARALMYLNSLAEYRRENYQEWVEVGMSLSQLGEVGLWMWDAWSKKSKKHKLGECAVKWRSFTPADGITLESLKYWAYEDNPEQLFAIPKAPKKPKPSDYIKAMKAAGWEFRMNEANQDVELNGIPVSEPIRAIINCALFEKGYRSRKDAEDCWINIAFHNSYHPVMDYLDRLEWDGEDHIEKLVNYFTDKHGVFEIWLTRWLIGAVARIAAYPRGQQNRMLVLDGRQNIGKSYFVRWLANDVPHLHMEGPINPDDKDDSVRLMSVWIWEVAELGSTFRKADREALKFFITKEKVQVRKSYGRIDTKRPAMASFIGTVNNEAGFLSDPTGSRRFMTCTLTNIDWKYAQEVDVSQVWARAHHLFKIGEPWNLAIEEAQFAADINSEYEIENPIEDYIRRYYEIDVAQKDWFTGTTTILDKLKYHDLVKGSDRSAAMQIGAALRKWGCDHDRRRVCGKLQKGWIGVISKSV